MEFVTMSGLLRHRILFLGGIVTPETVNPLIAALLLLDADAPFEPIDLYINSEGGSIPDGLAIIDAMCCIRAPVHTICIGQAMGVAAAILAAGSRGHRSVTANALISIREPDVTRNEWSDALKTDAQGVLLARLREYLTCWTSNPAGRIDTDVQAGTVMVAQEAKAFGIVDRVIAGSVRPLARPRVAEVVTETTVNKAPQVR